MREVALVLGGGGARGLAHIHVLEAFDDLGINPCVIAGSSIGAIVGAAYAAGMSGAAIRDYALATLGSRANVMARLWRLRPSSIKSMFADGMPRLGELNAERAVSAFLPPAIPASFQDLVIPLKVTATDFYGNALTVVESGNLHKAIAASIAIPGIFRPVLLNGRIHIDGGIASPVPFELVEAPGRIVVAVDVVGMPAGDPRKAPSRVEAVFGASQLMMQSITQLKFGEHKPEIFVRPDVNGFGVLDFLRVRTILERTRETRNEVRVKLARLLKKS